MSIYRNIFVKSFVAGLYFCSSTLLMAQDLNQQVVDPAKLNKRQERIDAENLKVKEEMEEKFKDKFSLDMQEQIKQSKKDLQEAQDAAKPEFTEDAKDIAVEEMDLSTGGLSLYELQQNLSYFGKGDYYRGSEKEVVLCIEDNAGDYVNQKKISQFVEKVLTLQAGTPLTKTVASERKVHDYVGAVSFPDKGMLAYLRDYVLKQNMISGVEHFFLDNISDTFLFSLNDEKYSVSFYKDLNDLQSSREMFYGIMDDFKVWIEDIEAYVLLETNLSDARKSEISQYFQRYYAVLSFLRRYTMFEADVDEVFDYKERKGSYYSLVQMVSDINDALSTMNIKMPTAYNINEISYYVNKAEVLYDKVFKRKRKLVSDFMQLIKRRKDAFSVFVVEKGFSDIIKREFKRRSISFVWFSANELRESYPSASDMILPASNNFEKLMAEFLHSWKDKDTDLKSDFFGKRSRDFVALTSLFHYLFFRMNKLKDSFRHDFYKAAHFIEDDKDKIVKSIQVELDKRLRVKKMFKTQKDYLNIREMNEVNMEVSRKINEIKNIFDRMIINYDKIMINDRDQMRIPFSLEMRGKDERFVMVVGKDVKTELKDAKYLLEKGILDEREGLSYKLMYDTGLDMEEDFRMLGRMFDDEKAMEKIGNTMDEVGKDAASIYEEDNIFTPEQQEMLLESTYEISNRVGQASIKTVVNNFDRAYEDAAKEVIKLFDLYDMMKLSFRDIIRLAETLNTKSRDKFVFYVDKEHSVKLSKDIAKHYLANYFSKQLDPRISEFIRGIDIAFSQADNRLVSFRSTALKNIIDKSDSVDELKKVFYLSLFARPFFKMDKDKLVHRTNVIGLFDHLRTRLILLDIIFSHKALTVDEAEFFAGFISDSFFKQWKIFKRKEHRDILKWEKEDLLDYERLLLRAATVQAKVNIIKEEFADKGYDFKKKNYAAMIAESKVLSETTDYDFVNSLANKVESNLISVEFPKAKIWTKFFIPKASFYDYARYALKKKSIINRWRDFISFDSLFEHESLTKFWYEDLAKNDILSRVYTGMVINVRDLIKVMGNLYLLESESLPYRFLISFDEFRLVDKLYIEKVTKSNTEAVFLPFDKELISNRFDKKVVDDIYDKVRFVLNEKGVLDGITREVSDVLVFEPVLKANGKTKKIKESIEYDHLLSFIVDNCMRMESKAPRKLSLGKGVYIIRNFEDVRERVDRIYHFISNSFLIRRNTVDVFDAVLHEMIHYWFYLFSFAVKKDETWIRGPYLFFNDEEKYKLFFQEFALIDGLDINMERRNYFKVTPEKLIEYRKAEELIALLIETVFKEKLALTVKLLDGRKLSFPLETEDVQILVWNQMLPFWMSPENINYSEKYITPAYYDKVFDLYVDILQKNDKKDRLFHFLDYAKNLLSAEVLDRRGLSFAKGYLFSNQKEKAYKIVMEYVSYHLKLHVNDSTLTKREYKSFKSVVDQTISQLTPDQVIDLLINFEKYFSEIQQFYFLIETDSELSQHIVFKYIVSYFMRNSFKLPELEIVKEIDHTVASLMNTYFKGNQYFYAGDLFSYFTATKSDKEIVTNILKQYLFFNTVAGYFQEYLKTNCYNVFSGFLAKHKYFYFEKEAALLQDMYYLFDCDVLCAKVERKLFDLFFTYQKAIRAS